MSDPEQLHAVLNVLKREDRPFTLLEIADWLSLTPEQAKTLCCDLLTMEAIDLEPLPSHFGQREIEFGFCLTCKGRWIFGQTVNLEPKITGFNKQE
jgi:hypothetical protein